MNVYFDKNFGTEKNRERPCKALSVRENFFWNGYEWYVLGAYVCGRGLVLDIGKKVPADKIKVFWDKWNSVEQERELKQEKLTQEEQELAEFENPLESNLTMNIWLNDKEIEQKSSCSTSFLPFKTGKEACLPDMPEEKLIEFYALDRTAGWSFTRISMKWDYKRIPEKLALKLQLLPERHNITCKERLITVTEDGELQNPIPPLEFFHPFTGSFHWLYVDRVWQESLPKEHFQFPGIKEAYRYPTCFQAIEYHFDENTSAKFYRLRDSEYGDNPVRITSPNGAKDQKNGCCSVGIIGGACGVTGIDVPGDNDGEKKTVRKETAYSRLTFEPVKQTSWQIVAVVERGEKMEIEFFLK